MDEEDQQQLLRMKVWPELRGRLWHATSVEASAGIIHEETRDAWWAASVSQRGNLIPHVEVCHRGPISICAVVGALVVPKVDREIFKLIEPGSDWQARIEAFAAALFEPRRIRLS
jgi:hypothetical protein